MTTEKFHQKENRINPNELVRLAPKLQLYLRQPDPTWPELIDAADWLRNELGVSKSLWGDACIAMGRQLAAVALAIVSTKDPDQFHDLAGGVLSRHHRQTRRRRPSPRTHHMGGPAPRDRAGEIRRQSARREIRRMERRCRQ